MAKPQGRLIIDPPASGTWNMAVDQALLESAESLGQTTFRIYFWEPATVSLGYFQKFEQRRQHEASQPCPFVRRKTGGGAIVHDQEITYSLCVPSSERWSSKNKQLYDRVHQSLIELLDEYGIESHLFGDAIANSQEAANKDPFLCFQRRANGDLIIGKDKVAGSAQRRLKKSLLQHGSILIRRSEYAPELPGIADIAESFPGREEFVSRWIKRLSNDLQIDLQSAQLSDEEKKLASVLESSFKSDAWNQNR